MNDLVPSLVNIWLISCPTTEIIDEDKQFQSYCDAKRAQMFPVPDADVGAEVRVEVCGAARAGGAAVARLQYHHPTGLLKKSTETITCEGKAW